MKFIVTIEKDSYYNYYSYPEDFWDKLGFARPDREEECLFSGDFLCTWEELEDGEDKELIELLDEDKIRYEVADWL